MRHYINLPNRRHTLPFSDAVLVEDRLYVSGRIGIDPDTEVVPANLDQEITFLLDGVRDVLAAASMTMDHLVFVQIFCPDLCLFEHLNQRYRACFTRELPARAFIGSGPLLRGGHFELLGIAERRQPLEWTLSR